jgi:hypothetical protein
MKTIHLFSGLCLFLLAMVTASPVLAATLSPAVTCPPTCSCLSSAEAAKINAPGLCGGRQIVCGSDEKNGKYCYEKPASAAATPQIIVTGYHVITTTPTTVPAAATGLHAGTPQTTAVPVADTTRIAVQAACGAGCTCLGAEMAVSAGYKRCSTGPAACGSDPAGQLMYCYSTGPVGVITPPGDLPAPMLVPAVISTTSSPAAAVPMTLSKRDIALAKLTGSSLPQSSTPSRLESCNGSLVNTWTDPANCGSCGAFCAEGLVCGMGQCIRSTGGSNMQSPCSAFQIQCNGTCRSYLHDNENCGACGNRCGVFETCCTGRCTNTNADPANCHDCGTVCGANAACSYGLCTCTGNTTQCGTRCVDPRTDSDNCGGCNLRCRGGETCCNGICTNTSRDLYNCGTCNHFCEMPYTCADGRCLDIATSEEHCGMNGDWCGRSDEICCAGNCINRTSDNHNCGACGNDCGFGVACCSGTCMPVSSFNNDPDNCGSCGNECFHAGTGSGLVYESCCNGRCTDTGWDDSNCGRCGTECPWYAPYCTDGYCYTLGDMILMILAG